MHKQLIAIILTSIILFALLSTTNFAAKKANSSSTATGYAIIKVIEEGSLSPINNATICIVETRCYYQTDKYGYSQKIPVPVLTNQNFNISLKRQFGEFTIIVYAPGYTTLVSYYNQVYAGMTNAGIVCKLPLIINSTDPNIISHANKPTEDYSAELVQLYKK